MSSQRRIDSSRANGAKSRGPVTPEGRARSRAAGLTHGLTSDQIVLSYESEEEFIALRDEYFADYQPQNRSQFDLVDQLVATRWRLNRVISLQGALMEIQMERQQPEIDKEFQSCGPEIRAAIAYQHLCDDSHALESLNRHETRLSAELRRTLKLLDAQLKNQKFHHEPSPANEPPAPQSNEQDPDREAPRLPPAGSAGNEHREFHQEPSPADEHPAPATNQDEPASEAPRIPPAGSTGDEQRATSGARARASTRLNKVE